MTSDIIENMKRCAEREECEECPYREMEEEFQLNHDPKDGMKTCIDFLLSDALAALTGQTARVMTLEELKLSGCENGVVLWLDMESVIDACRYGGEKEIFGTPYTILNILHSSHIVSFPDSQYGKGWRVWTEKPSESRREEEPWKN